jgi:enolase
LSRIKNIHALEILDSRGNPTIEVVVTTSNGCVGKARVPSGASVGEHEAFELRDLDGTRYGGKGVLLAVANVRTILAPLLEGRSVFDQEKLDELMCVCDGTKNKSKMGGNAILGVSLAVARAAAMEKGVALYQHLGKGPSFYIPMPMMNIINGGRHADNNLSFQEFLICPWGAGSFKEALRWGAEIFHVLRQLLKDNGEVVSVGDEGGFAPHLESNEAALDFLVVATEKAGYKMGQDVFLAFDCAASEYYDKKTKGYLGCSRFAYIQYLVKICRSYPICSIEDPLDQNDWEGWQEFTKIQPASLQIVGDDIFVTNSLLLKKGMELGVGNSILIKPNQIGTLTETLDTIELAQKGNYLTVVSHRSGETEDSIIADLAVASDARQIKTGSLSRSDRIAKYNRLLEIEDELGPLAQFIRPDLGSSARKLL